ncbi:MAG: alpha/beta fold hydrolase [Azoarcus sp.]|nr:alpha/beta fold hydrolase [Azoarcus sp.]
MTASAGTPLVLLHGWAMTPAVWTPLRGALKGIEIHAPALPGNGTTLAAWADALAPTLPPRAHLVGWSLGAMLALELAALHPTRVSRLTLIAATPRFVAAPDWPHGLDAATVAAFVAGYANDPRATLRRFLALQTLGDAAGRRLTPRLEAASVPHADAPLPALAAGLKILADADLRPRLAAVTQPVRLIHGDGDALMPLAAARWLADALPRAALTVLERCGHAPLLSRTADCAAVLRTDAQDVRP